MAEGKTNGRQGNAEGPEQALNIGQYNIGQYNEARYRVLAEQSGVMITLHRPGDWAYISVNPAVEQLTGFTAAELMGVPAYEMFHPEDAEAMKQKLIPAIYQHGTRTFRYRSRDKSGKYTWLESTHRSIRDSQTGELKEIVAVTRDVHQEVEAEQAIKRLADVVEASADLIIFCDQQHQLSYLNQAASQAWPVDLADEPHLKQLMSVESYQKLRTIAFQVAEQKGRWQGAIRLQSSKQPERFWQLEQLIAPQGNNDVAGKFYSLIIRDRSDEVLAKARLQEKQTELAHSARIMTLGEMASGLAHEINQPLATLLNYARGGLRKIERGEALEQSRVKQLLLGVEKQSQRAAEIISHLRKLVKKKSYQRQAVNIAESINSSLSFIAHELGASAVQIQFDAGDKPLLVMADQVQLEQVWLNLLRNGIEAFAEQERKTIKITMGLDDAGQIQLHFIDNASGIDEDFIAQVFEPYCTTKIDGLGLGLSISRSIIEAHGGQIKVESQTQSPSGSCFMIILKCHES